MKLRLPHKLQAALIATLASAALTTLSTGSALAGETAPLTFGADLGDVMYVGDSITHGIGGASWRWSMHKILVDNGISYDENGYNRGNDSNYSGGLEPGTPYGGVAFENVHSAHSGGDAYEVIGRARRGSGHYSNSNIYNWLGVDTDKTVRGTGAGTYTGTVTDHVDTFLMLIGTNDLLSSHQDDAAAIAGSASDALVTDIGNIYGVMQQANPGSQLVLLSIPCWTDHANNNSAEVHQAVVSANNKLKTWAESQSGVLYVDVNEGLVDVSSSTPFWGPRTFFRAPTGDGLHPNAQGELIIAGNVARAMGYAGRSVGLERSSAAQPADVVWTTPITEQTTITAGAAAQTVASGVFTAKDGYTVDFNAVYGNGGADGTWDSTHAFSITVGDGTHSGTLSLTEAYVKWGDKLLYSKDNSRAGDNLRIAYVNASERTTDNVSAGYYVWLGDKLIGEALTAGSASAGFNGVSLQATGTNATLSTLSWTNYAYAPTTTGYVNEEAAFKLAQTYPMPTHDNPTPASLNIDFSSAAPANGRYGTDNQPASGELVLQRTGGTETNAWFSPVGAVHSGNVLIKYSNLQAASGSNLISVYGGDVTDGNVAVVLDDGTHLGKGHYGSTGDQSVHGVYGHSLSGALKVEVNNATLDGGILMGVISGNGSISNGTQLLVNKGAVVGGNVYGGGFTGTVNGGTSITITGGSIAGSVYGGGKGGAVNGGSSITISGGVISGNVIGGAEGGSFSGATSVTVDGNLASIGGNIEADTVTLQNVASNTQGYTDGFDYYQGIIRAPRVELVDFTVERFMANIETQSLVLSGGSNTTLTNLTLTACDIDAQGASTLTLDGTLSLGETTTYSGSVALADGLAIDMAGGEFTPNGEYSEGNSGYKMGSRDVMKLAEAAAEGSALNVHAEALVGTGALAGNTFSYNAATGTLTATGADLTTFYVNAGDSLQYSAPVEENPVYGATDIAMNGGSLEFVEALKSGVTLGVTADGSQIIVDDGVDMAVKEITLSTLGSHALTLSGTMTASTAAEITANLIGGNANITTTGNISLTDGATSHAGGVLTVGAGLNFSLNSARDHTYNISSFNQIVLESGSAINYWGGTGTFNNVTLADGNASISITDMAASSMLTLAGQTQLNGHKLSITVPTGDSWKRFVTIAQLVGDDASTLSFEGGKTNDNSGSQITINSLQGFGGTLELKENRTGNALTATVKTGTGSAVNLKALNLTGTGEAVTVEANANLGIGTITVSGGSTLDLKANTWSSQPLVTIGKLLRSSDASTNTTVRLYSTTGSDAKAWRFVLGADGEDYSGDLYNGTLWVTTSNASQGSGKNRTVDVYLAAQDVLSATTLKTDNWGSAYNNTRVSVSLGTNAKVAGINSNNNAGYSGAGAYIRSGVLAVESPNGVADFASSSAEAYTLEITGGGNYTSNAYIMDKVNLHMNGTGTQSFSGGLSNMHMSYFDGSITVSQGTLVLAPNSTLTTHAVTVESNGKLTIAPTGSNVITVCGTMVNNGELTLNGTVALSGSDLSAFQKVDGSDQPSYSGVIRGEQVFADSGYLTTSAQYYLVKGSGTVSGSYTIDPNTGSIVDDKTTGGDVVVTFKTGENSGPFYVNGTDKFAYDATDMDAATDITIAKEAELDAASSSALGGSAKKLHGEGTYALYAGATALNGNLSLGTDWSGTVKVSNVSGNSGKNVNFGNLANGPLSTIELTGFAGYSNLWSGINVQNIKLTNPDGGVAWDATGAATGSNGYTATYSGTWSGNGTMLIAPNKLNYTFSGDISQWTGKLENKGTSSNSFNLTFTGNANAINAEIAGQNTNQMNLVVDTDATFSKKVTANTFTVNAGKTATLTSTASLAANLAGAGTLNLDNATLTLDNVNKYSGFTGTIVSNGENAKLTFYATVSNGASTFAGTLAQANGGVIELYGDAKQLASADARIEVLKKTGNSLSLEAGSENAISKVTVASGNTTWLLVGETAQNDAGLYTDIDFYATGGQSDQNGLIVRYGNTTSHIGSLSAVSANTQIRGDYTNQTAGRVLAVHQDDNTTFAGTFVSCTNNRSVALAKYGAGTLTLTGENASDHAMDIYEGAIELAGSGKWVGATTVHTGGTLSLADNITTLFGNVTVEEGGKLTLTRTGDEAVNNASRTLTLNSGATVDLTSLGLTGADTTPVILAKGGTIAEDGLDGVTVNLGATAARQGKLGVQDSNLVLTYQNADLIWDNNAGGNVWDTTSKNWHTAGLDDVHISFMSNDGVTFNESAGVALAAATTAGRMTLAENATVNLTDGTHNLTLSGLSLADGSGLVVKSGISTATSEHNVLAVNLGDVSVSGTGMIGTTSGQWDVEYTITDLDGDADSILQLTSSTGVQNPTVYNLNGSKGDAFLGKVELIQETTPGNSNRKVAMNINEGAETLLRNSEIVLSGKNSGNSWTGLGVNTDATVKGITSASGSGNVVIFSGAESPFNAKEITSGETPHTLTINTAGADFTTAAKVLANVNLQKDGAGTQTFSGDMSEFNGTLTLNAGTLAFTNSGGLTANGLAGVAGSTLSTTGNLTVNIAETSTFAGTLAGTGTFTKAGAGTLTLNGANTVSGGITVSSGMLVVNNAGALGSGTVTVAQDGNLVVNTAMNVHETYSDSYNIDGTLTMNNGSKLTIFGRNAVRTMHLGNVVVNGSAAFATKNDGNSWQVLFRIDSLSQGVGVTNANLELSTASKTSNATVYDLHTNQTNVYNGQLTVKQYQSGTRPIALNVTLDSAAQTAGALSETVIVMDDVDGSNKVGLGLGSNVTVKGIDSKETSKGSHKIFSGTASTTTTDFSSGNSVHTLTIDTDGTNHSTSAKVMKNVNLVKTGEGTQALSVDTTTADQQFNGSIDVEAGVLNIMNAASVSPADVTIGAGATMGVYTNGTATEANEGKVTIERDYTLSAGNLARLNSDLKMAHGSRLDVSLAQVGSTESDLRGLIMGSSVTIQGASYENGQLVTGTGVTLVYTDDHGVQHDAMEEVDGYLRDYFATPGNQYYVLFDSVEELYLNDATTPSGEIAFNGWDKPFTDANTLFSNVNQNTYAVVYTFNGSNVGVGTLAICMVPEPATGTLSLLALAALAARRRRK